MKKFFTFIACIAAAIFIAVRICFAAAAISVSPESVTNGNNLTFSWSGVASPTNWDWVGIYYKDSGYEGEPLDWFYTSTCSQSEGWIAKAFGSCNYFIDEDYYPGEYTAILFSNDDYYDIATSNVFEIMGAQLSLSSNSVSPGGQITVSWSGWAYPSRYDYIAMYSSSNNSEIDWFYTNSCTRNAGLSGKSSGSCVFTVPSYTSNGNYYFGLLDGDDNWIAWTENDLVVTACTNECSVSGATQCDGDGYQTCGNSDGDSCLEWSATQSCGTNKTCSNGGCVDVCTANYEKKCYNSDVYWYDSCGTLGTQFDDCSSTETCTNGVCVANSASCTANYEKKCYNSDVYWYDSCGVRGAQYDDCSSSETCSDGKCAQGTTSGGSSCTSHFTKSCYNGDVYWYDSCGAKETIYQDCGTDETTSEYQCSGNVLQRKVNVATCTVGVCIKSATWKDSTNCAAAGKSCVNKSCQVTGDAAPPVVYNLMPSGNISGLTATLSLMTNEKAECRFSQTDIGYDQMTFKFTTSDGLNHSAAVTLSNYGAYTYYVRCGDTAGNKDLASSKIYFYHPEPQSSVEVHPVSNAGTETTAAAKADSTPPTVAVASLSPSGKVEGKSAIISFSTDERAVCRFDLYDVDYDKMANEMTSDAAGTAHQKTLPLSVSGSYNYYIRCKDAAGNKNGVSAAVKFDYVAPEEKKLEIMDLLPFGTVYQPKVALELLTSLPATCRYSENETDYSSMTDIMSSDDNLRHIAIVNLSDFGNYIYNVGCVALADGKTGGSGKIEFSYFDPNESDKVAGAVFGTGGTEAVNCEKTETGTSDGTCTAAKDCVCDPDCVSGAGGDDPDCAQAVPVKKAAGSGRPAVTLAAVLAVVAVVGGVLLFLRKKMSG